METTSIVFHHNLCYDSYFYSLRNEDPFLAKTFHSRLLLLPDMMLFIMSVKHQKTDDECWKCVTEMDNSMALALVLKLRFDHV